MDDQNRKRKDDEIGSCLKEELIDFKIVAEADGNDHKLSAAINSYVEATSLSKCRKTNKRKTSKKKKSKKRTLMINHASAADQSTQTDFDFCGPFTWASGHPFSLQDVPHTLSLLPTKTRDEGMAALLLKNGKSLYDFTFQSSPGFDPKGHPTSQLQHSPFPHFSQAVLKLDTEDVSLKSPSKSQIPQLQAQIHTELPLPTANANPVIENSAQPGGPCNIAYSDPTPEHWYDELSSEEDNAQFSSQVFLNAGQLSKQQNCAKEISDKKSVSSSDNELTDFKGEESYDAQETKHPSCNDEHKVKLNGLTACEDESPPGAQEIKQQNITNEKKDDVKRDTTLQGELNCTNELKDVVNGATNFQSASPYVAVVSRQQNGINEMNEEVEEATTHHEESSLDTGEFKQQDIANEMKDGVHELTNVVTEAPDDAQVSKEQNCSGEQKDELKALMNEQKDELNRLTNEQNDGIFGLTTIENKTPVDAQVSKEQNFSCEQKKEQTRLAFPKDEAFLNVSQKNNSYTIKQLAIQRLINTEIHRKSMGKTCERKISVEELCLLISQFNIYDTKMAKADISQTERKVSCRGYYEFPVQSEPSSQGDEAKTSLVTQISNSGSLGGKISDIIPLRSIKKSHGSSSRLDKSSVALDDSGVDVLSPTLSLPQLLAQQSAAINSFSSDKSSFHAQQNIINRNAPSTENCSHKTMLPHSINPFENFQTLNRPTMNAPVSLSHFQMVNKQTINAPAPVISCQMANRPTINCQPAVSFPPSYSLEAYGHKAHLSQASQVSEIFHQTKPKPAAFHSQSRDTTTSSYPSSALLEPPGKSAGCLSSNPSVKKYSSKENPQCELKKEILEDILKKIPEAGSSQLGSRLTLKGKRRRPVVNIASKTSSQKNVEETPPIHDIKLDVISKLPDQTLEKTKNNLITTAESNFLEKNASLCLQKAKTLPAENEFNGGLLSSSVAARISQDELQKIKLASHIHPLEPNKLQVLKTLKFFNKKPTPK